MRKQFKCVLAMLALFPATSLSAQTEVMAWGNMSGIRVDGELMEFESSFRIGKPGGEMEISGKERQSFPKYHRDGNMQEVTTPIRGVTLHQQVCDTEKGVAEVVLTAKSDTVLPGASVYFCMELPSPRYGSVIVDNGREIQINGKGRTLKLSLKQKKNAFVRDENGNKVVYIPVMDRVRRGSEKTLKFKISADGEINNTAANVSLDLQNPGRLFMGMGGNFRLQNPKNDPKVIDYCLQNMRVAYGRVEMPWQKWQPDETTDPIAEARKGNLDEHVRRSMEMAQRLQAKGMPVIVSCWFPPVWAIDGKPEDYKRKGGIQAYRLNPQKEKQIYKSLADYLVYLKQEYGVETVMFSFNESDLGIDVLFTAEEHARFIKGFGAYMAERGLPTTLLLGDNSDATTLSFLDAALNDKSVWQYIGAVSFHSWRGCDDATLKRWADISKKINKPLIVGEGSTDAAAWRYPEIFGESTFAFYEINLYVRLCAICQPLSILQWQLTSDYSLLWGDGIFGSEGPLRPTQRFWNIKQLASTPENSFAIPLNCDKKEVNATAFGNISKGEYAVHLVNNGAACEAIVTGLPENITSCRAYVTNSERSMEELKSIKVESGKVVVEMPGLSFVTVMVGSE